MMYDFMMLRFLSPLLLMSIPLFSSNVTAETVTELSLEDLLNQKTDLHRVSNTASGVSESIKEAPASMIVITSKEISRRGYTGLDELLQDLPGFDTNISNGTMHSISFQRGYRTYWTQRTLVMIDGKVENMLWNHAAIISRQYPINAIEKVEVLYGPASVVYGPNAFQGIVNIVTKNAAKLADDSQYMQVSIEQDNLNSTGIDLSAGIKRGLWSASIGFRGFTSDEASINDYTPFGQLNPDYLSDPQFWGNGIGAGVDPVTGINSPTGDINLDGIVTDDELFDGQPLGVYHDPSDNQGLIFKLSYDQIELAISDWKTNEGYGPYYSFLDTQPNGSWAHRGKQNSLIHHYQFQNLTIKSQYVERENDIYGDWTESFGAGVSISSWRSFNKSWRIEQDFQFQYSDQLQFISGYKYEEKELMKGYMVCNYWNGSGVCPEQAVNSINGISSDGSGIKYANEINSTNFTSLPPNIDNQPIQRFNLFTTRDKGVFFQALWDLDSFRLNGGIRLDDNNIYGQQISPRMAFIYDHDSQLTTKFVYGKAFQEPGPINLYGSFNGRLSNANLSPETVDNYEFIAMYQARNWLHEVSMYHANYNDVISGASNVGSRTIDGIEYRGHFRFENLIDNVNAITGNLYYTYTRSTSQQQFDNELGQWVIDNDNTGDIAPHKINLIINWPLSEQFNLNLINNWVSQKQLYSVNPLRADPSSMNNDHKIDSFHTTDMTLLYNNSIYTLGLKVENLFEQEYFMPGAEGAGAGLSFGVDNDGFQNSLLPQIRARTITFFVEVSL